LKEKTKRKGAAWGNVAAVKGITWSDKIGTKVNGWAEGYGFGELTFTGKEEVEETSL